MTRSRTTSDDDLRDATIDIEEGSPSYHISQFYEEEFFPELYFRSIRPEDRQQIQALHEEWFPVDYQDEFYDALVYARLSTQAEESQDRNGKEIEINTCVPCEDDNNVDTGRRQQPKGKQLVTYLALEKPREGNAMSPKIVDKSMPDRIVACVVGVFVDYTILSTDLRNMLMPDVARHKRLFYIMTLGTITDYRRSGLASYLVSECHRVASRVPDCGAVYLHVLDTNEPAIRFYEKLGFHRVKLIPNYYSIHGRPRHCYLYAKYLNGNRGHLTIMTRLKRVLRNVWRQFTLPLGLWAADEESKPHQNDPMRGES